MTCTFYLLLIISVLSLKAQDYYITFSGRGASTTVDSVIVENITRGTKIKMKGSDTLHLEMITTAIEPFIGNESGKIVFYPNPMTYQTKMRFVLPQTGETLIVMYDLSGREIARTKSLLFAGLNTYQIEGVKKGFYIVRISSGKHSLSGKLISTSTQYNEIKISYEDTENAEAEKIEKLNDSKSANDEKLMQCAPEDKVMITGSSGIRAGALARTTIPNFIDSLNSGNSSPSVTINFYDCKDGDSVNYSVVQIGPQIWMGENLRTTKYRNGENIPYVPDNTAWEDLDIWGSDGYCWYNNDVNNKDIYGALYNKYALWEVMDICPVGWHIPTTGEWTYLADYLKPVSTAGGKLKETGTAHWLSPNFGATNEAGFKALPGGYRINNGTFALLGESGAWWGLMWQSGINYSATMLSSQNAGIYISDPFTDNIPSGMAVRCMKDPLNTVEDYDGNLYSRVVIGDQVWMGENLKTTHFRDGEAIPEITGNNEWISLATPGYCWYNNDKTSHKNIYGALYNWHAISTGKLCPAGWRVPADHDWNKLKTFLGGANYESEGGALKESGNAHWSSPNTGAINEYRFTALPGGHRMDDGSFLHKTEVGTFWSYTIQSPDLASDWSLAYNNDDLSNSISDMNRGYSVRCIQDLSGTVTDWDGNLYTTDTIGNQIWMGENLKTTHYNDGTPIPLVTDNNKWENLRTPGYCWYYNEESTFRRDYGALYNWHTVNTGKLCPTGWHVPSDEDWTVLTNYLGGEFYAGNKLKEAGIIHWSTPNAGATNESGFTALPGGYRSSNGTYYNLGEYGTWWTSTDRGSGSGDAYYRRMTNNSSLVAKDYYYKVVGMSVRCVKD